MFTHYALPILYEETGLNILHGNHYIIRGDFFIISQQLGNSRAIIKLFLSVVTMEDHAYVA